MWGFAKQRAAHRVNPHQFAAQRHQVQVGLQNLVFAPMLLQHLRRHGLANLLHHVAPALPVLSPLQIIIEQARQLHGDGGRAARLAVPQIAPGRSGHRAPVHPAVLVKTLVFAQHHRCAQCRGYIGQRHPLASAHGGVGAHTLQQLAVSVEDLGV